MTMRNSIAAARKKNPPVQTGDSGVFEFQFSAGDPVFAGHFPGRPILPGVFQLEMARVAAESVLDCPLLVREVRKAKFQRPVLPDETVRVELKLSEKDGIVEARAGFSVGGQPAGETILFLCREK
jgi:3-hydroxyacyl-[acyl-carrier-protein] dehydratase